MPLRAPLFTKPQVVPRRSGWSPSQWTLGHAVGKDLGPTAAGHHHDTHQGAPGPIGTLEVDFGRWPYLFFGMKHEMIILKGYDMLCDGFCLISWICTFWWQFVLRYQTKQISNSEWHEWHGHIAEKLKSQPFTPAAPSNIQQWHFGLAQCYLVHSLSFTIFHYLTLSFTIFHYFHFKDSDDTVYDIMGYQSYITVIIYIIPSLSIWP